MGCAIYSRTPSIAHHRTFEIRGAYRHGNQGWDQWFRPHRRNIFRAALGDAEIDIVAANDITDAATLAHLLKYDSVLGNLDVDVRAEGDSITAGPRSFKVLKQRDPASLPWKDLGVDIVVESTGLFTKREDASKHLDAGAKKVIISAPAKGEDLTIVMGVNHTVYDASKHHVLSNASCTTNCLAPSPKYS